MKAPTLDSQHIDQDHLGASPDEDEGSGSTIKIIGWLAFGGLIGVGLVIIAAFIFFRWVTQAL